MSNAVTIFGGEGKVALKNTDAMKAALDRSSQDDTRGGGEEGEYINFSGKRGVYEIGPDKDDADPDEVWLVNTAGFESGWICWKGGRPVAKRMASIYVEPVAVPDMLEHGPFATDRGEGWSIVKSMVIRSLDRDLQGIFTTNSKSGVSSLVGVQKEISARAGELPAWAVIQLHKEKFTAQGNTNYKPMFPIFGWLGDAQINKLSALDEITEDDVNQLLEDSDEGITSYDDVPVENGEDTDDDFVEDDAAQVSAEEKRQKEREVVDAELAAKAIAGKKAGERKRGDNKRRRASV